MNKLLMFVALLLATMQGEVKRVQRRTVSASYLLSESFDGATTCGAAAGSNCSNTWSAAGTPVITFNYATAPAPLEGSFSMLLGAASDSTLTYHAITAVDSVNFFFIVNHKVLAASNSIFEIVDSVGTSLISISNANPEWRIFCGTVSDFSTTITQGTTYFVWGDYLKGTGANAVCHLYTATTSTKPGSPGITITNGDATTQTAFTVMMATDATAQTIYDKLRVSSTTIGSSPP